MSGDHPHDAEARWAAPRAGFDELTGAAPLLTDPGASYITGAVLSVDGGWTAH